MCPFNLLPDRAQFSECHVKYMSVFPGSREREGDSRSLPRLFSGVEGGLEGAGHRHGGQAPESQQLRAFYQVVDVGTQLCLSACSKVFRSRSFCLTPAFSIFLYYCLFPQLLTDLPDTRREHSGSVFLKGHKLTPSLSDLKKYISKI